jgi:hypothetical protein
MVSISFKNNEENIRLSGDNSVEIFKDVCDWLYKNGYDFKSDNIGGRKVFTREEIEENEFPLGRFHKISTSDMYIPTTMTGNVSVRLRNLITMLTKFGIEESSIKHEGFETTSRIKKFGEIDNEIDEPIKSDVEIPLEPEINEPIDKIKVFSKNPFRQSICVLGESGAGKSTTLENILVAERHEFEFIIPSASTTGLLSQFSPSRSGYIPSRLGKMIVEAFNNPTTLYTAVFDECHKSNVIEMINDELLQAISTKRNMGKRFISLDEDTSELYKGIETVRGNILIPDNFGFIFISSKPRIISNNTDFFNRVNLVVLKSYEEEKIQTSDELLSKVLPEEEKMKLASTRND